MGDVVSICSDPAACLSAARRLLKPGGVIVFTVDNYLAAIDHFIARAGDPRIRLADDARELLVSHAWPGNVRELENSIERIVVLHNASQVTAKMLPDNVQLGTAMGREGDPSEASPRK